MSEQIRNKLLNFEVPPPPGVWDNIAQELMESNETLALSHRMHSYEVAPPHGAWHNIILELDNVDNDEVVVTKRTTRITYKLFMAAAFLGVVIAGGLYLNTGLLKKQITGKLMSVAQKKRTPHKGLNPKSLPVPVSPSIQLPQMMASASGFIISRKKNNTLPENTRILRNAIVSMSSMLSPQISVMVPAKPIRNESGDIIQNLGLLNTDDKYINVTGPNGEQTRISSKFLHVLLYLNGDYKSSFDEFKGYFDLPFFQSFLWKTRFRDWREKIMKTPFIPSSTNFLDILEFKDFISKEEE